MLVWISISRIHLKILILKILGLHRKYLFLFEVGEKGNIILHIFIVSSPNSKYFCQTVKKWCAFCKNLPTGNTVAKIPEKKMLELSKLDLYPIITILAFSSGIFCIWKTSSSLLKNFFSIRFNSILSSPRHY